MSKLNLNAPATQSITQLFGVDVKQVTDQHLTTAAKQLKAVKDKATKTAEGLNSAKLNADIAKLEKGLQSIVRVLDKEGREISQYAHTQAPAFDFEVDPIVKRDLVFGVFVDQLTEAGLKEAMAELSTLIKADTETNKAFNSSKIRKQIEENQKSLNSLVKLYDNLGTE